ncbi:hypothetical protein [Kitasatospora sp. NPDC085879]|uniref:hypothetical protein n=1 Tax=Kitasatospora sp. NPDC085879 TaxID=3154769 RepID=UPI00341DBCA4
MTRQGPIGPHGPEDAPADPAAAEQAGQAAQGRHAGPAEHEANDRRVLAAADFPLYAAGPAGGRDCLAGYEVLDGRLRWVELRSGDWSRPQGPYVSVRTHLTADPAGRPLPDPEDLVEDERDRLYDQLEIDEGDGPGLTRALRGWISVDGEPCPVEIHEDRRPVGPDGAEVGAPVWVGRLQLDGVAVAVTARGLPPAGVELRRVADVEPFVRGRTALARELTERQWRRSVPVEDRELPRAVGMEAHRAVVEHSIQEAIAMEAQLCSRRAGRIPRRLRGEAGAERWEAAVRQQMRLASESRHEAVEAVSAMVNQLTRLAQRTDWLVGTAEGEAAVGESVRYTVFASEVPSLSAQRAWERLWAGGVPGGADGAEEAWLEAWEDWRLLRRG